MSGKEKKTSSSHKSSKDKSHHKEKGPGSGKVRDPNAWKAYEKNLKGILAKSQSPDLLEFPKDDIRIVTKSRDAFIPDEVQKELPKVPGHMQDMIDVFRRDWVQVEYAHRKNHGGKSLVPIVDGADLPDFSFELDTQQSIERAMGLVGERAQQARKPQTNDSPPGTPSLTRNNSTSSDTTTKPRTLSRVASPRDSVVSSTDGSPKATRKGSSDPLNVPGSENGTPTTSPPSARKDGSSEEQASLNVPVILQDIAGRPALSNEMLKKYNESEDREHIDGLIHKIRNDVFHMYNPKDELKVTDDRTNVEWEVPPPVIEFLLRPKAILFDVQDIEPQYFVSMALYDIDTKSKITETVYFDLSSKSLLQPFAARFSLSYMSPTIYGLIRVEKVLQGDIETILENYSLDAKSKDLERLKEEANTLFKQHGAKYRQMMCWGVVQLFDDESEKFLAGTDKKIPIYKAKGIDDALLWELASNKEFKRLKPMNGGMIVDVVACEGYSGLAVNDNPQRPSSARTASRRTAKDDDDSSGSGKHMSMDKDMIEKLKDGKSSLKAKKLQKMDSAKSMFEKDKEKDKEKEEEDLKRMQRTKSTGKIKSPREISKEKEKEKTEAGRQTIDPIQKEAPAARPKVASPPPPKHFPPPPPNTNPAPVQAQGTTTGPAPVKQPLPDGSPAPFKQPMPGDAKGPVKLPFGKLPPGKFPLKGPPPKDGVKAPFKVGGPLPPPKKGVPVGPKGPKIPVNLPPPPSLAASAELPPPIANLPPPLDLNLPPPVFENLPPPPTNIPIPVQPSGNSPNTSPRGPLPKPPSPRTLGQLPQPPSPRTMGEQPPSPRTQPQAPQGNISPRRDSASEIAAPVPTAASNSSLSPPPESPHGSHARDRSQSRFSAVSAELDEHIQIPVAEFLGQNDVRYPNVTYVNNLYVYPLSVKFQTKNNSSASGKNICVKVHLRRDDTDLEAHPLKRLIGRDGELVREYTTSITFHTKRPSFYDEIKIQLPPQISSGYHLLFSFYHIKDNNSEKKSKKSVDLETLLGQAVLPICPEERAIADDEHALPVATSLPKSSYMQPSAQKSIKWLEGKKELFTVATRLESTVFTSDKTIDDFFKFYNMKNLYETAKALHAFALVPDKTLIQFFPSLMHMLLRVICDKKFNSGEFQMPPPQLDNKGNPLPQVKLKPTNVEAFKAILMLLPLVHKKFGEKPLKAFVTSFFMNFGDENSTEQQTREKFGFVFEEIPKLWLQSVQEDADKKDIIFKFSWFFLPLVTKSMLLYALKYKREAAREERFPTDALEKIRVLFLLLTSQMKRDWSKKTVRATLAFNKNMAYFLTDTFAIVDRGFLLEAVRTYAKMITAGYSLFVTSLKFDFLRVIIDYEHYVPLNVPHDIGISSLEKLHKAFKKKHYLSGLLLKDVSEFIASEDSLARQQILGILRNILWKHEFDKRYKAKELISAMYFPYVLNVVHSTEHLERLPQAELREWLICFLYILKNCSRQLVRDWLHKESSDHRIALLAVFRQCLEAFGYPGKTALEQTSQSRNKPTPEPQSNSTQDAAIYPLNLLGEVTDHLLGRVPEKKTASVRLEKTLTSSASSRKFSTISKLPLGFNFDFRGPVEKKSFVYEVKKESALNVEVSFTVLDLLNDFTEDFKEDLNSRDSEVMPNVIRLIMRLLQKPQAKEFSLALLWYLRHFIKMFARPLFTFGDNNYVGELTAEIIRMCNFQDDDVRPQATSLLFWMMKVNYRQLRNFNLMKLQTTVAVSKLVSNTTTQDFRLLYKGLEALGEFGLTRAQQLKDHSDKKKYEKAKMFGDQLKDFSSSLFVVLNNCLKINEYKHDPEVTSELFYQTSLGYTNSPELRISWLENLAQFHFGKENFEDAAQCKLYIAYMVTKVLRFLYKRQNNSVALSVLPEPESFAKVATNADRELPLPDLSHAEEEIANSRIFTERNLLDQLSKAIDWLNMAKFYEHTIEVYNLLIPMLQKRNEYVRLSKCYSELVTICKNLADPSMNEGRIWSLYYRVVFYGNKWGDLNGKEFIYKAPVGIRIAEMTTKLQSQFEIQMGRVKVQQLTNIKDVNKSELNPDIAYFQIVGVTPYFDSEELLRKTTQGSRNFALKCFLWERPFVSEGKAHGSVGEQKKIKTYFFTDVAYPYLINRLPITNKTQEILSPIENSIDLIEDKVRTIREQLSSPAPNPKKVQIVLAGTISPSVHAGVTEICDTFLLHTSNYPADQVAKLIATIQDMVKLCTFGLSLSRRLSVDDKAQDEFHKNLHKNLLGLKQVLLDKYKIDTGSFGGM